MRELSTSEAMVMKAIWDAGEDISQADLGEALEREYGKDYKRTTIATFLQRLVEKGYVTTYRIRKYAYVHAEISEQEYKKSLMRREVDFWFKGSVSDLIASLSEAERIEKDDAEKIRRILDGMDD